jgi:predicted nicotinamide N-methyase
MKSLSASTDAEALVREYTRAQVTPFVPEFQLHLASELVPLWQATEWRAASPQPPPFWAFAWPGSQALARYLLDHPQTVKGLRVLDFGSGGGLAAIAAARAGAKRVLACDLDPLAAVAQSLNAQLNAVEIEMVTGDALECAAEVDVILAGDVCYEREPSDVITAWLRDRAKRGKRVLLADPGRNYAPTEGLELLATYAVPTLQELESAASKRTRLVTFSAPEHSLAQVAVQE